MLTEGAVRASDKRAQFIGVDAYVAAGGMVLRDLFQGDDGGWLQDVALVDRLVAEKLQAKRRAIRAEGWKWIEVAPDFPYGHTFGLRQLRGETVPLTADGGSRPRRAYRPSSTNCPRHMLMPTNLPDEVDERLSSSRRHSRPSTSGRSCSTRPRSRVPAPSSASSSDGHVRVERGYVRPEDELPAEPETNPARDEEAVRTMAVSQNVGSDKVIGDEPVSEPEEDEGLSPIPDRLMTELTSHRTLGLRHAARRAAGCRLPRGSARPDAQGLLPLRLG